MTLAEYHKYLKTELEGGLYVNIFIHGGPSDIWFARRDYYTVKGGLVYMIEGKKLHRSGDDLEKLKVECMRVGKYDQRKLYYSKTTDLTYAQIKKALSL